MAYYPTNPALLPSAATLAAAEKKVKHIHNLEFDAEKEGYKSRVEHAALVSARRRAQTEISKLGTSFLKAHGFNGGGRSKRKIPGL